MFYWCNHISPGLLFDYSLKHLFCSMDEMPIFYIFTLTNPLFLSFEILENHKSVIMFSESGHPHFLGYHRI